MYYSPPTEVQQGATPSASKTLRAHLNQFSFGRCPAIFIFINSLHYHRFSVPPPHVVMVGDIPSLLHMFPANPVPLSGPNRLPILIGFINYLYYTSSTVPPPTNEVRKRGLLILRFQCSTCSIRHWVHWNHFLHKQFPLSLSQQIHHWSAPHICSNKVGASHLVVPCLDATAVTF